MGRITVAVSLVHCKPGRPTDVQHFDIDDMNTVDDFSKIVSAHTGKRVYLTYRGQPLDMDVKMHHYAPASASMLRFSASLRGNIARFDSTRTLAQAALDIVIYIKTLKRKCTTPTIHVPPTETVATLKQLVYEVTGDAVDSQRLIYAGKQLEDKHTLLHYGLQPYSTVHLVLRLTGGGGTAFVDVSNSSSLNSTVFSDTAPDWRSSTKGLNLEGKCTNPSCQAYRQMVIDPKGMVTWSLTGGQAHCPICHKQFRPVTCAFSGCLWAFDGCKLGSNGGLQPVQGDYQAVSATRYHRFEGNHNQAKWQTLVLSAKALKASSRSSICPICWEQPHTGNKHTTPCGHTFHATCIDAWMRVQQNTHCPMCRSSL